MSSKKQVEWGEVLALWRGLAVQRVEIRAFDPARHISPYQCWEMKNGNVFGHLFKGVSRETAIHLINGGDGVDDDTYAEIMIAAYGRRYRDSLPFGADVKFSQEAIARLRGLDLWHANAMYCLPGVVADVERPKSWQEFIGHAANAADLIADRYVLIPLPLPEFQHPLHPRARDDRQT